MRSKLAKLIAVAFAASMMLAIAGCSSGGEEKSAEETSETTE